MNINSFGYSVSFIVKEIIDGVIVFIWKMKDASGLFVFVGCCIFIIF
jgi:hypothetical protein